jgi:hypothetical protein
MLKIFIFNVYDLAWETINSANLIYSYKINLFNPSHKATEVLEWLSKACQIAE